MVRCFRWPAMSGALFAVAALGLAATACSPSGPSQVEETSGTTTAEVTDAATTSSDAGGDGPATGEPGDPVGSSPGDILTREDYLESLAIIYRIEDPPDVELVREVRQSEWGEVLPPCMAEFGFTVQVFEDGGWGNSDPIPSEQQEAYNLAAFTCEAMYPLLPQLYRPWDEATLQRVYDYLSGEVVPCIEAEGYAFDLPSFGTFRARYAEDRSYTDGLDEATLNNDVAIECGINIPESVLLDE